MIRHRRAGESMLLASSVVGVMGLLGCRPATRYPAEKPLEIQVETTKSIDLDAFRAQFATAYRGPLHTHERRAICSRPSSARGCVAKVTIQARGESKDIGPEKPIKGERVIAEIRNLDPQDLTEMYSLKPASQAEYLVLIDNGANGLPRWNLLEVPTARYGLIRRIPGEKVTRCPQIPEHEPVPYSDVDFSECGAEHPSRPSATRAGLIDQGGFGSFLAKLVSHFRPSPVMAEPGEWMYCTPGCCT